jgi:alkanesulfonate monooxygenase SsuD/methylene tetrahydromethanopterin reductase-like flavin-dependent oxidoreductase (luciferase family)
MDFGLGLSARHPSLLAGHARAAESAGFSHLWIYDGPRFAEAHVAMTHCAAVAPRLIVGTAVTNTETRDPTVTANAFATLAALTGGRVVLGIGRGDSAVKYLGQPPARFEAFREKVLLIRALLRGEQIDYHGKTLALPAPPETPPALLISADGPRTWDFAGAACDGAIVSLGGWPRYLRHAIGKIRDGAARAGRDPRSLYVCAWTHCVVGPTRRQAIDELVAQASRAIFRGALTVSHEALGLPGPLVPDDVRRRVLGDLGRQDREFAPARDLAAALGDDLLQEIALVGTPEDCARKVGELAAVDGVDQLALTIHAADREPTLRVFREQVVPRYGGQRGP